MYKHSHLRLAGHWYRGKRTWSNHLNKSVLATLLTHIPPYTNKTQTALNLVVVFSSPDQKETASGASLVLNVSKLWSTVEELIIGQESPHFPFLVPCSSTVQHSPTYEASMPCSMNETTLSNPQPWLVVYRKRKTCRQMSAASVTKIRSSSQPSMYVLQRTSLLVSRVSGSVSSYIGIASCKV